MDDESCFAFFVLNAILPETLKTGLIFLVFFLQVWEQRRGLNDAAMAVMLENLPSDYGDTDTEDDRLRGSRS